MQPPESNPNIDDIELGKAATLKDVTKPVTESVLQPTTNIVAPVEVEIKDIFPLPHCLVVDDAPLNRKFLGRLVTPYFTECSQAEDGSLALQCVTENMKGANNISVIFMDSIMPVMNGIEATAEIRKMGYKGVIIGVTGNVLPEQIQEFVSNGANCVIPKPVNKDALDTKIRGQRYMYFVMD